jgi:signal transduction histidine kinase
MVRALPGAEALAITLDSEAELPAIAGDRRRLQRVFVNLLGNAVKFTPPGGRIAVTVRAAADGGAVVTVADTGVGIAAADRERVLEPFVRGDGAAERAGAGQSGIGLGLAIARMLTERHGGRLVLDSTPGVGTTITIALPPADGPGPA